MGIVAFFKKLLGIVEDAGAKGDALVEEALAVFREIEDHLGEAVAFFDTKLNELEDEASDLLERLTEIASEKGGTASAQAQAQAKISKLQEFTS